MSRFQKEKNFVQIFQNTGLNYKEALVYFTLIKSGNRGSIVKELIHALPGNMKRTTIYSTLRKLVNMKVVMERGQADTSKNATIFIATKPTDYYERVISKKRKELEFLKELKIEHSNELDKIYSNGIELKYEDIDDFIKPYFKPLMDKGWKVKSLIVRKEMPLLDYVVYDCMLYAPHARYLKDNSYHLFIFDYNIEKDKNALQFFVNRLKKKTKEMKSYFFDIKEFQFLDDTIEIDKKIFPVFKMGTSMEEFRKSEYFTKVNVEENDMVNIEDSNFREIGKAVIVPIKNKLFYLWAESDQILQEMIIPILKIEMV